MLFIWDYHYVTFSVFAVLYKLCNQPFTIFGASRSEPHTGDVNGDFPFVYIYLPYVRPSFRIYLSSISTIYNISSVTHMRTRRTSEHFNVEKEGKLCDIEGLKRRKD